MRIGLMQNCINPIYLLYQEIRKNLRLYLVIKSIIKIKSDPT